MYCYRQENTVGNTDSLKKIVVFSHWKVGNMAFYGSICSGFQPGLEIFLKKKETLTKF